MIGFSIGFTVPDVRAAALVAVQQGLDPTKVFVINEAVSATLIVRIASAIFIMASSTGLLLLGVANGGPGSGAVGLLFCLACPA